MNEMLWADGMFETNGFCPPDNAGGRGGLV
ncbi:hypothetical protein AVEN_101489-1, partial [Araneus ventricosus]